MEPQGDHHADQELVRSALAEDQAALDLLLGRLRCVPRILAVLNQRMGGHLRPEDLGDLTQDTLALLWERIEHYNGQAALETWVYGFCFHGFMNAVRKGRRRGSIGRIEESSVESRVPGPGQAVDYEHLYRGMEQLEERERRVIRLKHFEELTFEEIGARLVVSPNTVKTCYYRGMKRLEEILRRSTEEVSP